MTTASDAAFLDTNVLVYAADQSAALHSECRALLDRGLEGRERLVLSPQILSEFIAVVTNPSVMPNPLPPPDAYAHAETLAKSFELIAPTPQVFERALDLLRKTGISGKRTEGNVKGGSVRSSSVVGPTFGVRLTVRKVVTSRE
jgi:predicted nucleic acid-binding protein